jgi:hypothetical protein
MAKIRHNGENKPQKILKKLANNDINSTARIPKAKVSIWVWGFKLVFYLSLSPTIRETLAYPRIIAIRMKRGRIKIATGIPIMVMSKRMNAGRIKISPKNPIKVDFQGL